MITVEEVAQGLVKQGYRQCGGSDVWRILTHPVRHDTIKVFYNDYKNPQFIIVRESVEEH